MSRLAFASYRSPAERNQRFGFSRALLIRRSCTKRTRERKFSSDIQPTTLANHMKVFLPCRWKMAASCLGVFAVKAAIYAEGYPADGRRLLLSSIPACENRALSISRQMNESYLPQLSAASEVSTLRFLQARLHHLRLRPLPLRRHHRLRHPHLRMQCSCL